MRQDLDITREHCPMTFVKVKLALARLAPGDVLRVTMAGGEPVENVPRAAREQGHRVGELERVGEQYRVTIEKAAP